MVQHAALLDSSSAGLWSAVHNERPDMAARSSAMNFFLAGCSWAVPVGNVLLKFLQPLGTCCRMHGPADVRKHIQVGFLSLEPAQPVRSYHHTHFVGRLHVRYGPTRPALVDRAYQLYEGASSSFRWSADICACSQPRALGSYGLLLCLACPARMIVRVFTRSVCLARGESDSHGEEA